LRSSAELGLTTSVFFARFVAMRRGEEGDFARAYRLW
jgi:hypothetical protein